MFKEFREFALRGNVMDMAVGIIIGAAFGRVISSLVNDILMPPLGMLMKGVDFSNLFFALSGQSFATLADAQAAGVATINYGVFITQMIDFIIVAFAIFFAIKWITVLRRRLEGEPVPAPTEAPTSKECPHCISQIPLKAVRCPHCTSTLA